MGTLERRFVRLTAWLICLAVHSFSQPLGTRERTQDVQHFTPLNGLPIIASDASRVLQASSTRLKTCIITADFWGMIKSESGRGVRAMLKGGGGTATATHLLANTLREQDFVDVTFLGVTKEIDVCTQAQKVTKGAICVEVMMALLFFAVFTFSHKARRQDINFGLWLDRCTKRLDCTLNASKSGILSSQKWWRHILTRPSRYVASSTNPFYPLKIGTSI